MPKLLAIVPEDGWAFVHEAAGIVAVCPPFLARQRCVVPEAIVADAVTHHGFQAVPEAPEESWSGIIARIREAMAAVPGRTGDPESFLERALAVSSPEILAKLPNLEMVKKNYELVCRINDLIAKF
jgi:hypothetical protein